MTHYVEDPKKYPTKKAFREAILAGENVRVVDPAIVGSVSGEVRTVLRILESRGEEFYTVTNHPKRSWYATVDRGRGGQLRVS